MARTASEIAARRVGLRAHCFRFSARTASEWLLGEFVLPPSVSELPFGGLAFGPPLPLFGTHRFGVALGGLAFGLTASAFRPAPIRRLPLGGLVLPPSVSELPSAGWPSGSLLPLFDLRRFGVATGRVRSSAFRFGDYRWAGWPSGSPLPLFGLRRFGVAAGRVRSSAFRFGDSPRRVGLRTHGFRFSARTASEWPLGGLAFGLPLRSGLGGLVLPLGGLVFGLTASAFRPAPLRSGRWASSFFRLPFRSCRSAGWPSGSLLPLFGMHHFGVAAGRIGLRASASEWPRRAGSSAGRVGLRAHCFRFSACTASEWPLGEFVLPPSVSELPFGGLAFGLTASAFRHAPLRGCRWAGWFLRLPFRSCRSASWPSGSRLSLFGTHRSAPPHRRSEGRRSTPTRHLFHFKTLIPTC